MLGPWRRLHLLSHDEDDEHDHDLADEHESPGEIRRYPAADDRPDRDRGPRDTADDPVGERTILPLIVGRGQSGDGRDDEHGAQPFDERPADEEHAEVWAQRGGQRAEPVDGETDGEGPVAPPDVAELGPDEHECRHHERVGGDRELDAGHGRVEVVHDLRDRDVHHAGVEHHHELRGSKDGEGKPAAHRANLLRRHCVGAHCRRRGHHLFVFVKTS